MWKGCCDVRMNRFHGNISQLTKLTSKNIVIVCTTATPPKEVAPRSFLHRSAPCERRLLENILRYSWSDYNIQ